MSPSACLQTIGGGCHGRLSLHKRQIWSALAASAPPRTADGIDAIADSGLELPLSGVPAENFHLITRVKKHRCLHEGGKLYAFGAARPAADTQPVHLRERAGRAPRCAKPGSTALRACAARASRRSPTSPCPPLRPGRSGCCPRRSPSRRGAGILASIRSRSSSTPGRAGLP